MSGLKNNRTLFFWLVSFLLWAGCASTSSENKMPPDPNPTDKTTDSTENNKIAIDSAQQKAHQMTLDSINKLTPIELLNYKNQKLEQKVDELTHAVNSLPLARLEEFENRLVMLNENLIEMQRKLDGKDSLKTFYTKKPDKPQPLDNQPIGFKNAMKLFMAKDFVKSKAAFESFARDEKPNSYTDDAWFYAGESCYENGDYGKAIGFYERIFTLGNTDKDDDAQFKMAMSYLRIGDKNQASAEFKKLTVIFSDSEYISRANTELQKLNVDQ